MRSKPSELPPTRNHYQLATLLAKGEWRTTTPITTRASVGIGCSLRRCTWPTGTIVAVRVERSWSSTDRKLAGTRLRHPGRGRNGLRLEIRPQGHAALRDPLYRHDTSETYRTHREAREWVMQNLRYRQPPKRIRRPRQSTNRP
jgi:hypothetical protein